MEGSKDPYKVDVVNIDKNVQEMERISNNTWFKNENKEDLRTKAVNLKEKILSKIPPEELAGLSKNQRKKLIKKKILEENRMERRKHERERRKMKRKELREAGLELPQRLKLKHFKNLEYTNFKVVIDLDFYDFMSEYDSRMVSKQVNACYALNRIAVKPLQLYATSFTGPMKELFIKLQPGSVNWIMNLEESNYTDLFPLDKIVYLTSDSDNILETMEENKVYVIGGIVDHNQHKGLCHRLAVEKGISHAQLPINKYINLATRKVLTINHVFGILSKFLDTKDWKEAFFSVLPKRKGLTLVDEEEDAGTASETSEEMESNRHDNTVVEENVTLSETSNKTEVNNTDVKIEEKGPKNSSTSSLKK